MTINWKLRFKNIHFWIGLAGVILSPVLAAKGIALENLTTWTDVISTVNSIVNNPYILGSTVMSVVSFIEVINDPTRKGLSDSYYAMNYTELK